MERSLMKGNEALAEAAIRAGCKCFFGYPITPQTELSAYMAKRMEKSGGVFLQGNDLLGTDCHAETAPFTAFKTNLHFLHIPHSFLRAFYSTKHL